MEWSESEIINLVFTEI